MPPYDPACRWCQWNDCPQHEYRIYDRARWPHYILLMEELTGWSLPTRIDPNDIPY